MRHSMAVMIIGAGTGGLALAHGLKQAGIGVSVFERDRTPRDDQGGYRVGISPAGSRALKACLPSSVYDLFVATPSGLWLPLSLRTKIMPVGIPSFANTAAS